MWKNSQKKFKHPRYRINRILLGVVGLWPYQSKSESRFFIGLLLVLSTVLISAQIRKVIIEEGSLSIVLQAVGPFLVDFTCVTNLVNFLFNSDKMYQMMERIEADRSASKGPEGEIVERYADEGWTLIVAYSLWLYLSAVLFLSLPFMPKIIVAFGLMNITAPAQFPFPVDYYIDNDAYYAYLQIHVCITVFLLITIIISTDGIFVMYVQHNCGILAAICYRLEHLIESEDLEVDLHPVRAMDREFLIISDCIRKHSEAIQFATLLEAAFSWSFFFQLGFNMMILVFTAVQIVWNMGKADEAIRQALLTGAEILHLLFACYFSQRLTNHSLQIFEALNKTTWYKTSMRSRQLLNFMIMRSIKPCELKAGKLYTLSMENFSTVIRTSMSYFMILCSVQ